MRRILRIFLFIFFPFFSFFILGSCQKEEPKSSINLSSIVLEGNVAIPSGMTYMDLRISNLGESCLPNSKGEYKMSKTEHLYAQNMETEQLIYIASPNRGSGQHCNLDAKETAIYFALLLLPDYFSTPNDEAFNSMKSVLYSLQEVKILEQAIQVSVNKKQYLDPTDFETELGALRNLFEESFKIRSESSFKSHSTGDDNTLVVNTQSSFLSKTENSNFPSIVGKNKFRGVWMEINKESTSIDKSKHFWNVNCSFHNENSVYLGVNVGTVNDSGRAFWDVEEVPVCFIPPMNVGKFMETFTTWSGMTQWWTDTRMLFNQVLEWDFKEDTKWDKASVEDVNLKLNDYYNAVVVTGPENSDIIRVANCAYMAVQSLDFVGALLDSKGVNNFVMSLLTDIDFVTMVVRELEYGRKGQVKIVEEVFNRFQDFLIDNIADQFLERFPETIVNKGFKKVIEGVMLLNKVVKFGGNLGGNYISGKLFDDFFFQVNARVEKQPLSANGLVAYYPFDGNANDMSGNNNHGKVNGALLTADRKGYDNAAYKFRGHKTKDYISVSNSPSLQFDKHLSISVWFRLESFIGSNGWYDFVEGGTQSLIAKDGDRRGFDLLFNHNDKEFNIHMRNIPYSSSKFSMSYGEKRGLPRLWNHIVCTIDNNIGKMYLNGSLVKSSEVFVDFSSANRSDLIFGRYGHNGGVDPFFWFPFDGVLDDIRIYNRTLTDNEVLALSRE